MIIRPKEEMKKHTSFKIGGPAECYVIPENFNELSKLLNFLKSERIITYVIGNGTNILVGDEGIAGCVVEIGPKLSKITVKGNKITAEAGATLAQVAEAAEQKGLTGLEPLSGIPGTVGGAVAMNAGAYNTEMKDVVESITAMTRSGEMLDYSADKLGFGYRTSSIEAKKLIVTKVVFNLSTDNKNSIKKKMAEYKVMREKKQPLDYPSAGSIFKRPEKHYAGVLISDCNFAGKNINDAEVSRKHCGFIINKGNATAKDVTRLIELIQNAVLAFYGIQLEPEIKMWGKFTK